MHNDKLIDDTTYKFLYSETRTRTPTLYFLPKIHKPDIPGWPIISGCGDPTAKLSQYADHLLKLLLKNIPSYVQDTTHFLKQIFSLNNNLPNNIVLVTIDVKSLYTNISNDEGIKACKDMLKEDTKLDNHTEETITEMLSLIRQKLLRYLQWTLLTNSWNSNGIPHGTYKYLCKHIHGCPWKNKCF